TAAGLRAIVGAELTIEPSGSGGSGRSGGSSGSESPRSSRVDIPTRQTSPALPVLCESADGYRNLCRLITRMKMRSPKGEGALQLDELDGCTTGLVALAGRAALDGRRFGVGGLLDRLVGLFGRGSVYVELQRHLRRDEERDNDALASLAAAFRVPTIATNGVRFATPASRPLFDVLTCIHHHTDLVSAG